MRISRTRVAGVMAAGIIAAFSLAAGAQSEARPRPPGTLPLEEVPIPPPPPLVEPKAAPTLEEHVTTRTEGGETIQEYRVNGKLYMQRVTPKVGKPYVLVDHQGTGTFVRQDNPLDSGVRVPQWVLLEF